MFVGGVSQSVNLS